jgi:hypothetical protein
MKRITNASQYWTTAATCRASSYIYRAMHWRFHRLNCKSPQQMTQLLAALTDPEHAAACEARVKSSRDKVQLSSNQSRQYR